jgi:predicted ester cyclase
MPIGDPATLVRRFYSEVWDEADEQVARNILRGSFFGVAATGQRTTWSGAAFFVIVDARIKDIWVLGDLDRVKQQLGAVRTVAFGEV